MDRAGQANWGGADEYLGGIVDAKHIPFPVYHAYRLYGSTQGQIRVNTTGSDQNLAALASKSIGRAEILVGCLAGAARSVNLEIHGPVLQAADFRVLRIPASHQDIASAVSPLEAVTDFRIEAMAGGTRLVLPAVQAKEFYQIVASNSAIKVAGTPIRAARPSREANLFPQDGSASLGVRWGIFGLDGSRLDVKPGWEAGHGWSIVPPLSP